MVYEKPEIKMTGFDVEDVITTSSSDTTTTTVVVSNTGNEDRDYI